MSRPYFKDDKNVPFGLKSIRRMTPGHFGRRNEEDEDKDMLEITYPDEGEMDFGCGDPDCLPNHDPACVNWDKVGYPRTGAVNMPTYARPANSIMVEIKPNDRAKWDQFCAKYNLAGRYNTLEYTDKCTTFMIQFPVVQDLLVMIKFGKDWISSCDVLYPYRHWPLLNFFIIVKEFKGKNELRGTKWEADKIKLEFNPDISPQDAFNRISELHEAWMMEEFNISDSIGFNPDHMNYGNWDELTPIKEDENSPEKVYSDPKYQRWIARYRAEDMMLAQSEKKAKFKKEHGEPNGRGTRALEWSQYMVDTRKEVEHQKRRTDVMNKKFEALLRKNKMRLEEDVEEEEEEDEDDDSKDGERGVNDSKENPSSALKITMNRQKTTKPPKNDLQKKASYRLES